METVLSALIGAGGAIIVCVIQARVETGKARAQFDKAIALIELKINQLTTKVDKHNNLVERTYRLEQMTCLQDEKIKVANHRIEDLEKEREDDKK